MSSLEKTLAQIQEAELKGDQLLAADSCSTAGKIYLERNIYPEASLYFQRAGELYSQNREFIQQAHALNQRGVCLVLSGQANQALGEFSRAKKFLAEEEHQTLLAAIEGNIGLAYSELKDHKNAAKSHKSVLETARKIKDPSLELNALINLADSNLQDKKYQPAQGFALVALDLAKAHESHPSLMIIYDLLGMISARQADLKTALEYHRLSFETAREFGDLLRQGIALANQALALEGLTELDQAYQKMVEAQEIFILLHSDYQVKIKKDLNRITQSRSPHP